MCAQHCAEHDTDEADIAPLSITPEVPTTGAEECASATAAVAAELAAAEQRLGAVLARLVRAWRRRRPRTLCTFWAETLATCPDADVHPAAAAAVLARWDAFCAAQGRVPPVSDVAALAETVHALRECLHEVQADEGHQTEEETAAAVDAAAESLLTRAGAVLRLHACTQPYGRTPLHNTCTAFLERVSRIAATAEGGNSSSSKNNSALLEECRMSLQACDAELTAALTHVQDALRVHGDRAARLLLAVDHAAGAGALGRVLRACVAEGRAARRALARVLAAPVRGADACAALVDAAVRCSELVARHAAVSALAGAAARRAPDVARRARRFEESSVAACAAVRGVRVRVLGGGADVAAHIDALVADARDPARLAAMFEGWMAWV